MLAFRCMKCQGKITVPHNFQGRQIRCPQCKGLVLVPMPTTIPSTYPVDRPSDTYPHPRLRKKDGPRRRAPVWLDYLRSSKPTVCVAFLIIVLGLLWLLATLELIHPGEWVWPAGLISAGFLTILIAGVNRQTLIVGPYLVVCAGFAIARQNGLIDLSLEIPCLIISLGIILLLVTLAGFALPELIAGESSSAEYRKQHGQCVHCGHDLREAKSSICPECGRSAI